MLKRQSPHVSDEMCGPPSMLLVNAQACRLAEEVARVGVRAVRVVGLAQRFHRAVKRHDMRELAVARVLSGAIGREAGEGEVGDLDHG